MYLRPQGLLLYLINTNTLMYILVTSIVLPSALVRILGSLLQRWKQRERGHNRRALSKVHNHCELKETLSSHRGWRDIYQRARRNNSNSTSQALATLNRKDIFASIALFALKFYFCNWRVYFFVLRCAHRYTAWWRKRPEEEEEGGTLSERECDA